MDTNNLEMKYRRMSDAEIMQITKNATALTHDECVALEHEVKRRNLNPALARQAQAQTDKVELTMDDVYECSRIIQKLPCPVCGDNSQRLNGTTVHTVMSFLVVTTYSSKPVIACPDCLDKKNNNAILTTALLGWWGIPWGLLRSPQHIYRNIRSKGKNRLQEPNDVLLGFTYHSMSKIYPNRDNKERLRQIIQLNK